MNTPITLLILLVAAVMEAGGDALVRLGIHSTAPTRLVFFACGAVLLFVYGCAVNAPPWDFGRLLGVYVVFVFLVAQAINWLVFHRAPSVAIVVGGLSILAGGVIISVAQS